VSDQVQHDISNSQALWITTAGRPISIVEDAGLQQTLHTALQNDSYKLPSRRTVDGLLRPMYDSKLSDLKKTVESLHALAMTSDFWTSLGNEAYCGITGYWMNDDWELQSAVLECRHTVERHFAQNVAELFTNFVYQLHQCLAGYTVNKRRSLIDLHTVNMLVCLQDWCP